MSFQNVIWLLTAAVELLLIILMVVRRNRSVFPVFFWYIVIILLQSALLVWVYRVWGFNSIVAYRVAWFSQIPAIAVRALVAGEVCRRLLRPFSGIWALAWRLLLACAFVVLFVALIFSEHTLSRWILVLHRGVELSIASIVVCLFVFAKYYEIRAEPVIRQLALGLFLYSGFEVLNNTALSVLAYSFSAYWVILGMLAFLASLLVWTVALRHPVLAPSTQTVLLPGGIYLSVAPAVNDQLRELNDRLASLFRRQGSRP